MKKMSELKLPVDEDFAEYIMVMLHNNKTQKEVQTDLEPFLGTSATVFTPWLFSILEPESSKPGMFVNCLSSLRILPSLHCYSNARRSCQEK